VRIVELEYGGLVGSRDRRQAIRILGMLHSLNHRGAGLPLQRNRAP
jgi:hypothetical protein